MHVEYSANALIVTILLVAGCNDAIYTLGRLPAEAEKRNSCRDAGSASADPCVRTVPSTGVDANGGSDAARTAPGTDARAGVPSDASGRDARGSPPGPSGDACPDDSRPATRKGLNVYLLVDDSLSVVLQPAWNSLTLAISAFVDDPKNVGVGLGIGYYGSSCTAGDYLAPTVRVAPLPDTAQAIKSTYPLPISGKALTPALTGALEYAHALVRTNADRDTVMVLVTDGIADPICGSTETNAAQVIAAGLRDPAPVRTYVIALGAGPTLLDPANIVDLSPLDSLAAAGGTTAATRIEVNLSTNTELTSALNGTVASATPCAYKIPADIDAARAELAWRSGGAVVSWPRVPSEAACGVGAGSFVRADAPTYLELCPAACTTLKAATTGSVLVRTACK